MTRGLGMIMESPAPSSMCVSSLPASFQYEFVDGHTCRASLATKEDILRWMHDYQIVSGTSFTTKCTVNTSGHRVVARKLFICQHSGIRKKTPTSVKRKSKNLNCRAEINITIHASTPLIRARDPYVGRGFPAVIVFKNEHSHDTNDVEALSALKPTDEMRDMFIKYFEEGFGIKAAKRHHESRLPYEAHELEFSNARINPKYEVVRNWYHKWIKSQCGPVIPAPSAPSPSSPAPSPSSPVPSAPSSAASITKPPINLIPLMTNLPGSLEEKYEVLKKINSLNKFLTSAISLRDLSDKLDLMRPTSIRRRRPGVSEGRRKGLPGGRKLQGEENSVVINWVEI